MIFVDKIKEYSPEQIQPGARRVGKKWSHMWCDGDIDELHRMAASIGMKRAWFQNHPLLPHYDVVPSRRARAIANGAQVKCLKQHLRELRRCLKPIIHKDS